MKSIEVTPEEMSARTARFANLRPYSDQHDESSGIPRKAMEKLTAHRVYPIMAPETYTGRSAMAPVKAGERVVIAIAECPPGDGPGLHNHEITTETFFCLEGTFEVTWGDEGEHKVVLEPMDLVSVPQGVMRAFRNISDVTGRLHVTIELGEPGSNDRVAYHPEVANELEAEFGAETVETLKEIGFKFYGASKS